MIQKTFSFFLVMVGAACFVAGTCQTAAASDRGCGLNQMPCAGNTCSAAGKTCAVDGEGCSGC